MAIGVLLFWVFNGTQPKMIHNPAEIVGLKQPQFNILSFLVRSWIHALRLWVPIALIIYSISFLNRDRVDHDRSEQKCLANHANQPFLLGSVLLGTKGYLSLSLSPSLPPSLPPSSCPYPWPVPSVLTKALLPRIMCGGKKTHPKVTTDCLTFCTLRKGKMHELPGRPAGFTDGSQNHTNPTIGATSVSYSCT